MCGIAGIVYQGREQEVAKESVRRMIAVQRHRGPDGEGFYDKAGISLGHCRLAIIDLAETGQQPMPDRSGRYWITFNGEIYNYIELAEELKGLGHQFLGHSDTEVLLNAYCQWGEQCVTRLRGMFAFAVWDQKEKILFAARDHLGIKPFHYWIEEREGKFAFSSEIKALLPFLPTRKVNRALAQDYLAWNLLDHQESDTMLEGIKRLPPGHTLVWTPDKKIVLRRYWTLSFNEETSTDPTHREALVQEFKKRFEESIGLHLRSDVAVGTCLSGGLDSSAIVCAISAEIKKMDNKGRKNFQHTFSAYFEEPRLDEREYIKEIIADTGCTPHFVNPQGEWLRDDLENWLWHQEEPVGGTGAYVQYCVARLIKQEGVKVVLDGQGADELLAGYRKFIVVFLRQLCREGHYLRAAKEGLAFFSSFDILKTTRVAEGRRYLFGASSFAENLWPDGGVPSVPIDLGLKGSLGRRLHADLLRFSLPVLLRYEDRNSMAFGIESRVPFLDHPLVEWLGTLPADMKLGGGWTKRILREGLSGILPEGVRTRKSKLGFSAPETEWLSGPLNEWLHGQLNQPKYLADVVSVDGVRHLLAQRIGGDRSLNLQNILFRLAIYESWANQFLEAQSFSKISEKYETFARA